MVHFPNWSGQSNSASFSQPNGSSGQPTSWAFSTKGCAFVIVVRLWMTWDPMRVCLLMFFFVLQPVLCLPGRRQENPKPPEERCPHTASSAAWGGQRWLFSLLDIRDHATSSGWIVKLGCLPGQKASRSKEHPWKRLFLHHLPHLQKRITLPFSEPDPHIFGARISQYQKECSNSCASVRKFMIPMSWF